MTTSAADLSPLFQRIERQRKPARARASAEDRRVDEALAVWAQWVTTHLAPRDSTHRVLFTVGTIYEGSADNCFLPGSRKGHSNPVLAAILQDERNLNAWPKTIHALITDMPRSHRCALLGQALGYSQSAIGQYISVSQPRVCLVIQMARRSLAIQLAVMDHVKRAEEIIQRQQSL
jgi:hypothetical protein